MSVNIWSTHIEEIEKNFRGHLPQNCIVILARMSEEARELQRAINAQETRLMKMMQFIVLTEQYKAMVDADKKKFDKTFDDPYKDIVQHQGKKDGFE